MVEPAAKKPKPSADNGDDDASRLEKLSAEADALGVELDAEMKKVFDDLDSPGAKSAILKQAITLHKQAMELKEYRKTSVPTLINNPPQLKLTCRGNNSSHTGSSKHRTAETVDLSVAFETIPSECVCDETSFLLHLFSHRGKYDASGNQFTAHYSTESDVSHYVAAVLDDAVAIASKAVGKTLCVKFEYSLFSNRPDILAVIDSQARDPIMAVEVKKPFLGETTSGYVHGQILDYLMEMRAFGHRAPFVVLSTFEKSWMYCEDNETSRRIASDGRNRLEEAKKVVQGLVSPSRGGSKEHDKKTPSPPGLVDDQGSVVAADKSSFKIHGERNVAVSGKPIESSALVPMLYTALICALTQNPTRRIEELNSYTKGTYTGIALMLNKEGYNWGELQVKVGRPVLMKGRTRNSQEVLENTYFAIKPIGRGSTSKVFHAFNWQGRQCAIKMYIKQWDGRDEMEEVRANQDIDKAMEAEAGKGKTKSFKEKSKERAVSKCKKELENFDLIYPNLKGRVLYKELNSIPCVVMPLFSPLSKEERLNAIKEGKIEACLNKFQERSLKYEESDLGWRHVGHLINDETGNVNKDTIVMYDLADLEHVSADENPVSGYVEVLSKRLEPSDS